MQNNDQVRMHGQCVSDGTGDEAIVVCCVVRLHVLSLFGSVDLNAADTGVQLKPATTQQERKPQAQGSRGKGGGCC